MKRRQEEHGGSRPNSKRQEVVQANRISPDKTKDGLAYLKFVREAFNDGGVVYAAFMEVMQAYREKSVTIPEVIAKVKVLFKDHHDVILGFNTFLPKDYMIKMESLPKRPVNFGQAIDYVQKIKARFGQDEHSYREFIKILYKYRDGQRSSQDVYEEVADLLRNYPDLLEGFMCFLPENNVTHSIQQVEMAYKRDMEDDFGDDKRSSEEHGNPNHFSCIAVKSDQCHGKKLEREEDRDSREQKQLVSVQELDEDGHTFIRNKGKSAKRGGDYMRQMGEHRSDGNKTFAGSTSPMPLIKGGILNFLHKKVDFLKLVKGNLHKEENFQEFLKRLNMHSDGIITQEDLSILAVDLFPKSPELIGGLNDLVSHCQTVELGLISSKEQGGLLREKSGKREQWTDNVEPEQYVEQDKESELGLISSKEQGGGLLREKSGKRDSEQRTDNVEPEQYVEQDKGSKEKDALSHKPSHTTNSSKYSNKPVSELDLSKCDRCTPSYRLLPDAYPLPNVGSRTALGHAVLNDSMVSVTSGSEDYSFKHMRKNQYEESLFRCEDDRFELDVLLESTGATIRCLEELLKKVKESRMKEIIHIDDHLTAIQLRCIERIYGDHGLDVIDLLCQDVGVALPVVLNRLRQKHDEWLKGQADMNKVWAEVFAKNYQKSLDNRSSHFKQQDTKTLSTKALLAEIKETNAINTKSDGFIISKASWNSSPIIPDLKLEYPDAGINEDLYQILKHSAEVVCSTVEQSVKVMRVWKDFLGPIFGARHGLQETKKVSKCKSVRSQDIVTSINDTTGHGEKTLRDVELQTVVHPMYDEVKVVKEEACAFGTRESQKDAGRQCNRLRSDNNTAFLMADLMSMDHCIDDTNQQQYPEREEREEGELSSSQDDDKKFMEIHSSCTPLAEVDLCESATKHCLSYCTAKEGRNVDCKGENGHTAKGFYDNEKASTQRISEGSDNDESEAGDDVSCSESANADDLRANYEDEEQIFKTGGAGGIADLNDDGLINADQSMQGCLPLFPIGNPSVSASFAPEGDSVLFYGNDNMYILLRLHQALHDRLHTAKVYAAAAERKLRAAKDDSSPELYYKFLQALYEFVDGTADSAKFEDVCRSICGNESYLFVNLDKLIFKLVKQFQAVACDEMATKLCALHAYEQSHAPHGPIDTVYHANASGLLRDENVYRFERMVETGQLFIQLMERFLEEGEAISNAMPSTYSNVLLERSQKDPLFLKRNMLSSAVDDEQMDVYKNVCIANGLELKLSCSPYKVSYIFGTEDFFHRRKWRPRVLIGSKLTNL